MYVYTYVFDRSMTVAEYFKATGRTLRRPDWPCVDVGAHSSKVVYIPLEQCTLLGGQRRHQLDRAQTADMLKAAKQEPAVKRQACIDQAGRVASALQDARTDQAWGIRATNGMMQIPARVLPPPILQYGQGKAVAVGNTGAWNLVMHIHRLIVFGCMCARCVCRGWGRGRGRGRGLGRGLGWGCRDTPFAEPGKILSWGVAVLISQLGEFGGAGNIIAFVDKLADVMRERGMTLPRDRPPVEYIQSSETWTNREGASRGIEATMRAAFERGKAQYGPQPQLLLVIMAEKVVVARQAKIGPRGAGHQYLNNVVMKINLKVNGVNVTLAGELKYLPVLGGSGAGPFMILGTDVSHPTGLGPRLEATAPSIAAVVGSTDKTLGRWATRVMVQAARQEVISGLDVAVAEIIQEFMDLNRGHKPQRLLMYRDGVSEGQFDQILSEEFLAIRKACLRVERGYQPLITFVVVQKNHNTRLFPADRNGPGADLNKANYAHSRRGNVAPGVVVDEGIVAPAGYDFYLNSHAGLQGTNKPAHYHVLVDEIGFGADGIQLLTYWMCYLFQRATSCPPG
ncbi:Argonaute-like protein [Volvox carteri f. nagariensis]|uniref:Argonaute-like protein n=1 Tax=Volvox carteri f. nagariensis TaxID=3068 RepID=D8U061_VOLCA|nr:Argonaute-like protein [Volvox carteri f. nagariensis]EFJ46881.1 Argonaute-like protein [Volvox carteri f. nagariensis]|eukprot:XP_002952090.1 Argonaute-like protein [Volvox carteri f. nagariensis]